MITEKPNSNCIPELAPASGESNETSPTGVAFSTSNEDRIFSDPLLTTLFFSAQDTICHKPT